MSESDYWRRFRDRGFSRRAVLKSAAAFLGSGALAAGLAGCGQEETAGPVTGGTPPAAGTPTPGGDLVYSFPLDYSTLDPQHTISGGDDPFLWLIHDNLLTGDTELEVQPQLATSWEMPDDMTYIFKLRQGVKFHDGTDFNAAAVKYNLDRLMRPEENALMRSSLKELESWQAIDDFTFQCKMNEPYAPPLAYVQGAR